MRSPDIKIYICGLKTLALLSTILSRTNVFQRGSGLVQPPQMMRKKREGGKWRYLKNGR